MHQQTVSPINHSRENSLSQTHRFKGISPPLKTNSQSSNNCLSPCIEPRVNNWTDQPSWKVTLYNILSIRFGNLDLVRLLKTRSFRRSIHGPHRTFSR